MTELALVVMAVLLAGITFVLGLAIGFYASAHAIAKRVAAGMKAAGIDRETAERVIIGIKRGEQ